MRTAILLLSVALLASLAGNILLWQALSFSQSQQMSPSPSNQHQPNLNASASETAPQEEVAAESSPATSTGQISAWIESNQLDLARLGLAEQLKNDPNNIELLLLEAEYIVKTEPLSEGLIHYFELLEKPISSTQRQTIEGIIDTTLTTAISQLKSTAEWDLLAQFLEPLFQRMPTHRDFVLNLAEAYGQQAKFTLMEDILATLPNSDSGANAIRNRVYVAQNNQESEPTQARVTDPDTTRIPLEYDNNRYATYVEINGIYAQLLIDTGATTSAISAQQFAKLSRRSGYEFVGVFNVNTAGGRVRARMVKVDEFALGPFVINDVSLLVLPTDTLTDVDGLLGMNVLKLFDFSIDQAATTLNLRARNTQ